MATRRNILTSAIAAIAALTVGKAQAEATQTCTCDPLLNEACSECPDDLTALYHGHFGATMVSNVKTAGGLVDYHGYSTYDVARGRLVEQENVPYPLDFNLIVASKMIYDNGEVGDVHAEPFGTPLSSWRQQYVYAPMVSQVRVYWI